MQAFKTKAFARWADGEGLGDEALVAAVAEMQQGLIDARLGGQVVKKRVAFLVVANGAVPGPWLPSDKVTRRFSFMVLRRTNAATLMTRNCGR